MTLRLLTAVTALAIAVTATAAEARTRHFSRSAPATPGATLFGQLSGPQVHRSRVRTYRAGRAPRIVQRSVRVARVYHRRVTRVAAVVAPVKARRTVVTSAPLVQQRSGSYRGMLWAKVQELVSSCGSKIVSGYRAGPGQMNHGRMDADGHSMAYDMHGNPACMYARLANWPGGATSDYWTAPWVNHIHLSLNPGGNEMGWRGAHHHTPGDLAYLGGGGAKVRYAAKATRPAVRRWRYALIAYRPVHRR